MNIIDIINKKEAGLELSKEEIEYVISGYLSDEIKDYQMSSLLMAICIKGMEKSEINYLTNTMLKSGDILDLSSLGTKVVDKHSTGGVGDKTTLIITPLVASCGVTVAKMSGRSLGSTGGTIDKLESIPGMNTTLSSSEFQKELKDIKCAIAGQTANLVPADKKIYALRDVTGTTESIPLIASSIMSKKLASGASSIVIDVKVGKGALINNIEDARTLANIMVDVGRSNGKEVICLLTNMDIPLGYNIGNSLEIEEAIDILNGKGEPRLSKLCITLASYMVMLGKGVSLEEAEKEVKENLENKKAYEKFKELIAYQKGELDKLPTSIYKLEIKSQKEGYLTNIDALEVSKYLMKHGAGRETKEDKIDYTVGLRMIKNINDYVEKDEIIAYLHTNEKLDGVKELLNHFEIENSKKEVPLIYEVIM